ncbi:MAG: hypothetical protein GY803_04760 [Chloroflexi bacterium]|nr:hypothetical protein [Chloroflexota bacterium]
MKWKNFYEPNTIFFFTSRITDQIHILRTDAFKQIVIDVLRWYMAKHIISLYGYVLMSNHIHLLLSAPSAKGLEQYLQHTLRKSSLRITASLQYYTGQQPDPPQYVAKLPLYDSRHTERAQGILDIFASHAHGKAQYAVWKEQARGIPVRTEKAFQVKLDYVHMNPVRAGIVTAPDEYAFSSFRSVYLEGSGYLPISFPEWR